MKSDVAHKVRYRKHARDIFYTPVNLAKILVDFVPIREGDSVLDPCKGDGAFYNNFPDYVIKDWCEIEEGKDFFDQDFTFDWCVSNPPYSIINPWLEKTCEVCETGFAYLFGLLNVTSKRIEFINEQGFGLTKIYLFKIFEWFGESCFMVFEKAKEKIV